MQCSVESSTPKQQAFKKERALFFRTSMQGEFVWGKQLIYQA